MLANSGEVNSLSAVLNNSSNKGNNGDNPNHTNEAAKIKFATNGSNGHQYDKEDMNNITFDDSKKLFYRDADRYHNIDNRDSDGYFEVSRLMGVGIKELSDAVFDTWGSDEGYFANNKGELINLHLDEIHKISKKILGYEVSIDDFLVMPCSKGIFVDEKPVDYGLPEKVRVFLPNYLAEDMDAAKGFYALNAAGMRLSSKDEKWKEANDNYEKYIADYVLGTEKKEGGGYRSFKQKKEIFIENKKNAIKRMKGKMLSVAFGYERKMSKFYDAQRTEAIRYGFEEEILAYEKAAKKAEIEEKKKPKESILEKILFH